MAWAFALVAAGLGTATLAVLRVGGEEADGALVYARRCAFCHDVEGAIGADITAVTLASYETEDGLYRYLRLAMPYEAPGTMTDDEYRATARHLMETRSIDGDSGESGPGGDVDTERENG